MEKKTIGFFGGSFDPIHWGHLSLAIHLLETEQIEEVLFCPAYCSPFKLKTPPVASPEDRLNMLKAALDHPQFKICTYELENQRVSYTIDTIRRLTQEGKRLRLLLSEESAAHLEQWREAEELIHLAPPLLGPRKVEISSTEIRARLKKKLYCRHLLPIKALDYIEVNHLYSS